MPHAAHFRARRVPHSRQNFARGWILLLAASTLMSRPSRLSPLGRSDILIQVEQIGRIILRFQRSQALVVRPVGCRDGVLAIVVSQIVYVAPRREAGPH